MSTVCVITETIEDAQKVEKILDRLVIRHTEVMLPCDGEQAGKNVIIARMSKLERIRFEDKAEDVDGAIGVLW